MGHVFPRARALLATGVLFLPLTVAPATAATATTIAPVEVLTQDPFLTGEPLTYPQDYALQQVEEQARANPAVYAVPYVSGGEVRAPVVNTGGGGAGAIRVIFPPPPPQPDDGTDDLTTVPPPDETEKPVDPPPAAASVSAPEQKTSPAPVSTAEGGAVAVRVMPARYSWSQLEAIKDDLAELTPAVLPGMENLINAAIHPERNQVVLEATAAPDALRTALAARYGPGAVAILLTPGASRGEPLSRQDDGSPYYGGSKIYPMGGDGLCTTGFTWQVGGVPHMLTAGHCTAMGGTVKNPRGVMGTVIKDNWGNSKGTVKIDGQTSFHGDLALVRFASGKTAKPRMYVGAWNSSASRAVGSMNSRRMRKGDRFCTGGQRNGEICGWIVLKAGVLEFYPDGTVLRNSVRATKLKGSTGCNQRGDSGGPVYTVNSRGKVVAKGIISGGHVVGDRCYLYFTDIWDAFLAMPGSLKTG
ncbi:trypsin-like serine protease [Rhizohabitans arisaemae]|uniref:trypsin-like serine protease n=1 Tax=Rhizohabitans arisaemae TaxID=2720610 RepID=UPI0024B22C22|nr:trypsin-like serine protease [Rhizohabitans arisaemae]